MMRALSALVLMLLLAVTSVTQAVARSEHAGAVAMVICAGGQTETALIDAQGNPVEGPHHCPDCLQALAGGGGLPVLSAPARAAEPAIFRQAGRHLAPRPLPVHPAPRGPPVLS
jgi:hypothetical protein